MFTAAKEDPFASAATAAIVMVEGTATLLLMLIIGMVTVLMSESGHWRIWYQKCRLVTHDIISYFFWLRYHCAKT